MLYIKPNKIISSIFLWCIVVLTPIAGISPIGTAILTYQQPVVEVAELKQDGSLASPWIYNLTHTFSYVTKMIWALDFQATLLDFGKFDGTNALTNGVNVLYNGISLIGNDNITQNHQFAHFAYNMEVLSDEQNPKDRLIIVQWLLTSFIPDGLIITPTKTIQIYIQDNLTALSTLTEFSCTFKGYLNVQEQIYQTQPKADPLDVLTTFISNNSATLILIGVGLIGPVIIWVFWRKRR